jgi:hypothetical protein
MENSSVYISKSRLNLKGFRRLLLSATPPHNFRGLVHYQTAKKIRQVFDYKRRNGQYIGSFAPYGYIKDPKDKHLLIVDLEAAEIVKRIYEMCLQGTAKLQKGALPPTSKTRMWPHMPCLPLHPSTAQTRRPDAPQHPPETAAHTCPLWKPS